MCSMRFPPTAISLLRPIRSGLDRSVSPTKSYCATAFSSPRSTYSSFSAYYTSNSRPKISSLPRSTTTVGARRNAPTFPFLGSLFKSSTGKAGGSPSKGEEDNMSYPDNRSNEEWRAVLSPR